MFKKCLCSTSSTGKRRKLSYLLTLSYYLHLQRLELGFLAYNENSHFFLSTPHLSGQGTTQWAFPVGTLHKHFKLNMATTKFIIFIFTIYIFTFIVLCPYVLKFSLCTITHHGVIASSSKSMSSMVLLSLDFSLSFSTPHCHYTSCGHSHL